MRGLRKWNCIYVSLTSPTIAFKKEREREQGREGGRLREREKKGL